MARDVVDSEVVESRDALVAWLEAGCKPAGPFRIGAEHEKIPFYRADHSPVPYGGDKGIRALLEGMRKRLGWDGIDDGGNLIGLYDPNGGGPFRSSRAASSNCQARRSTTRTRPPTSLIAIWKVARSVAEPLAIGFLALGMSPKWSRAETPIMPKGRYAIMARYMPKVGTRGLDMMFRTATVQANLDFASEADMVAKMRVGLALQPAITALFANSPFTDGKLNGLLSARSKIWRDTDAGPHRHAVVRVRGWHGLRALCRLRARRAALFRKARRTNYRMSPARSFATLAGRLGERRASAPRRRLGEPPATIFPEVRLKRYLEMRGADVGPPERIVALAALMAGSITIQRAGLG